MTQTLTANTARSDLSTALVAGLSQPFTPKRFLNLVFGETVDVNLFLIDNGVYDARSGVSGYTPRISVTLDDLSPASGSFKIDSDTFEVVGAGTTDVNGVYVRNGTSLDGNAIYTLYDSDGVTAVYNLWSQSNLTWEITPYPPDTGPIDRPYVNFDTHTGTPPLTGWLSVAPTGIDPPPILAGGGETTQLEWDATETEIEDALNAVNNGAGPSGGTVTVEKFSNGQFSILWDSIGKRVVSVINASGIQPLSAGNVIPVTAGSATAREEQILQIKAEPLVFQDGGATITNGWRLSLDTNNSNFLRAVVAEQGDLSANYSIEIVSPTSTIDVVARGPVILLPATFNVAALAGIEYPNIPVVDGPFVVERLDISALDGSTVTDLDSIATVGLDLNYTVLLGVTIGLDTPGKTWALKSGTDANNPAGGIVRPDDYATTTNEKVWKVQQ